MNDVPPLRRAVAACVGAVHQALSPGDLAGLRRLSPDLPVNAALYRTLATFVEPHGVLPRGGDARDEAERRWGAFLQALATGGSLVQLGSAEPLGVALARAGLSELRLDRLLRATDTLPDEVRSVTAFLASKGGEIHPQDLADLLLGHPDHTETVRRRIARDFFRTEHALKAQE